MNEIKITTLQPFPTSFETQPKEVLSTSETPFSDYVKDSLEKVNREMVNSDRAIVDFTTGKNQDIHGTMIAMQKAEVSFELVMQIRNKLVSAYEEIKRMSI